MVNFYEIVAHSNQPDLSNLDFIVGALESGLGMTRVRTWLN